MLVPLKDGRDRNVEKGNGKNKKNSKTISLGHLYQVKSKGNKKAAKKVK